MEGLPASQEGGAAPDEPEARAGSRQVAVVVVSLVVVIAALAVAVVYLARPSGVRYLTMTEYYDLGEGNEVWPWNWPTFANGSVVRVQDRIQDIYTDFSPTVTMVFRYTGVRFATDFAFESSADNLCHYGVNDTVRLVGTVSEPVPGYRGVWGWSLEEGSPAAPTASLGPMSMVGSEVRIPVAAATGDCKGVHLRVQLWQNGFSVDGMFLRYDGIRGIYLRYVDADGSGTLSQGDVIRVVDPPTGSLEIHLFFRGTELASAAWTSP